MNEQGNTFKCGSVTVFDVYGSHWVPAIENLKNLTLYGGADIIGQVMAGKTAYTINTAYFEFSNGAVPSITPVKDEGRSYYDALVGTLDYLRVPLNISPSVSGSTSDYTSNQVVWHLMTAGVIGEKGLAFSQAAGSKVYGAALVAAPTGNPEDDIVFARIYFADNYKAKLDGGQIGLAWPQIFLDE
jgi:hypothetical protein